MFNINHLRNSLPPMPYKKVRTLKRLKNILQFKNVWHWIITNGKCNVEPHVELPDVAVDDNDVLHVIMDGDESLINVDEIGDSCIKANIDTSRMQGKVISVWQQDSWGRITWQGIYGLRSGFLRELDLVANHYNISGGSMYITVENLKHIK